MTDEVWRPLGVDDDQSIATYDALREGVPDGMYTAFWEWVQDALSETRRTTIRGGTRMVRHTQAALAEHAAQALDLSMGSVRANNYYDNIATATSAMQSHDNPMVVADFLLAYSPTAKAEALDQMLQRSRSAWAVGERAGRPGLVRRQPEAVGSELAEVVRTAGSAGVKLVQAWEAVYGVTPNASHAFSMAIRAVEDAAIPVVVPKQGKATLGHVIGQLRQDGDWRLAFTKDPDSPPPGGLVLAMCEALWNGQHDRHGGEPSAPGSVSDDEARAAVSLAVSLVHWFTTGMVARR